MSSDSTTITPRLAKYLRRVYSSTRDVLEYSREKSALEVWEWPTDSLGGPMATNVLSDNCRALGIPHPGCLCPLQDVNEPPFVEASINLVTLAGSHYGEYVAECSTGSCGYLVPLLRIFLKKNADIYNKWKSAPTTHQMGPGHPANLSLFVNKLRSPNLKRCHASLDLNSEAYTIAPLAPPHRRATDTEILLKLDDYNQPGLYDAEFRALLGRMVRCPCGMVMLRRVFKEHRCTLALLRPLKRPRLSNGANPGDSDESEGSQEEDITINGDINE